ncbi:hypothetical protein L1987_27073 [Smallanthus sonchifolius]|uniref:Uncharacterized protein n=1 Tax=Smallanthus sonchifolius TaxID=185202 RepID=A0ACB9IBB1_9ASTR|nr:hypothetical protein L1987_27073 [Smallanthus sonchifolius]
MAWMTLDTRHEASSLNISPMCQDTDPLGSAKEQDVKEVSLDAKNPDVKVLIGSNIPEDIERNILSFLKGRKAKFVWKHEEMTGISKDIITHRLGIEKSFRPIHQKRRKFAPKRNVIIQEEVERLLKSGMIREVKFLKWLANVVVVPRIEDW